MENIEIQYRADTRLKISKHDESATLMENEIDAITLADEIISGINVQPITAIQEQISLHGQARHSKRILKKPMVQRMLEQSPKI